MKELRNQIERIINRLTQNTKTIFYDKLFSEAGEFGIGEAHVMQVVEELKQENIVYEPCRGILKRIS